MDRKEQMDREDCVAYEELYCECRDCTECAFYSPEDEDSEDE